MWEFWIYYVYRRILGRVLVGNIVNIRNECLIFWVHGEWIVARNKQIVREPLRNLRDLFVPRSDSFPVNQEKRHSFLKWMGWGPGTPAALPYPKSWQVIPPPPSHVSFICQSYTRLSVTDIYEIRTLLLGSFNFIPMTDKVNSRTVVLYVQREITQL